MTHDSPATTAGRSIPADAEIIKLIRMRDESALSELLQRYGGRVKGLCELIVIDPLDAESVTSDVFLELWNRPEVYNPHRGSLRTFLLTLARSRAIDRVRSTAARNRIYHPGAEATHLEESAVLDEPSAPIDAHETKQKIECAMSKLPPGQQQSLKLAFFGGLTHREVAEQTSLPLGTVKTNIRSGLLKLRKMLSPELKEGEA